MNASLLKKKLSCGAADARLSQLYGGKTGKAVARCKELVDRFVETYGDREGLHIFSAPGRTEIGGNHTDHNKGKVLAAAVNLDALAVAAQSSLPVIRVQSAGHEENLVMLKDLRPQELERNTSNALIRGVAGYFAEHNLPVGGFDAVTTSDVLAGSGLSSSAAFEVLIGATLDHLYGQGELPALELAMAGRFAENRYFGKPCGLMDQTVSACGGLVHIDFGTEPMPLVSLVNNDVQGFGHALYIIGPIGSHADLTQEYAAIPQEMGLVAGYFHKNVLREVREEDFMAKLPELRVKLPNRAVLRAMHFFAENRRVQGQTEALERKDYDTFLRLVRQSGRSSFMYLQNITCGAEQSLGLALGLAESLLNGSGAVRVHGGGFAGTIQAFVPLDKQASFIEGMDRVFGAGSCHLLSFRSVGSVMIL